MKPKSLTAWMCSVVFVLTSLNAQEHALINNAKSPFMPVKSVDYRDVRWTDGLWADRVKVCEEVMVPNLGRLMDDPEIIHAYENFLVAAGEKEGEFRGWSFHDGDFYKYVEALTYAYALTKDEKINQRLDEIIRVIAKAQRPDGYLTTFIQIGHGINGYHYHSENKYKIKNGPYTVGSQHEFYNLGHLMTAACVHYRITGKRTFLNVAIKAADNLYDHFKVPSPQLASIDWNPPHYMGLIELYRSTGDRKYVDLVKTFVDMRTTAKKDPEDRHGRDYAQRRTPIREESEAIGHAGFANYYYAGVTDLYAETGEKALWDAMERIWQNVTTQKMYITGATGPHYFGGSNRELVSEAYGLGYELPHIKAYNETCANIGNAMWNWRLFLATGEARFMDVAELVFHNSALSGIALDGTHFCYTNPLRYIQGHPQVIKGKDDGKRGEWMSVFCCPPNIIRTIASLQGYAYATSDKGIWVNLYGANVVDTKLADGSQVKLTQKTEYPWNGLVKLSLEIPVPKEFSVMLRIPGWVTTPTLKVNGQAVGEALKPGSYFELRRTWKNGDVVELDLPMVARVIEANPMLEDARNQVAIKRGPLVYCLEAMDLPAGVHITDVMIPASIQLKPRFDQALLSGVTVLEGTAQTVEHNWDNRLYRPFASGKTHDIPIKMIPYYAWANRQHTDMTVWMPLLQK